MILDRFVFVRKVAVIIHGVGLFGQRILRL